MQSPTTPKKYPDKVNVENGKTYYWCACGLSQKQPYCDGAHKKDRNFKPVKYVAKTYKVVFFVIVN